MNTNNKYNFFIYMFIFVLNVFIFYEMYMYIYIYYSENIKKCDIQKIKTGIKDVAISLNS